MVTHFLINTLHLQLDFFRSPCIVPRKFQEHFIEKMSFSGDTFTVYQSCINWCSGTLPSSACHHCQYDDETNPKNIPPDLESILDEMKKCNDTDIVWLHGMTILYVFEAYIFCLLSEWSKRVADGFCVCTPHTMLNFFSWVQRYYCVQHFLTKTCVIQTAQLARCKTQIFFFKQWGLLK